MSKKKQGIPFPTQTTRQPEDLEIHEEPTAPRMPFGNEIENCILEGTKITYVKFRFPAPPVPKKEPVYEFHVEQHKDKYSIDGAIFHPNLLIWSVAGKMYYMPSNNVLYCY